MMEDRKNSSWKPLIRFLKKSKLPWWLYVIQIFILFFSSKVAVFLTDATGKIASGEITDPNLIKDFTIGNLVTIIISLIPIFTVWVTILFDCKIQIRAWKSFIDLPIKVYEKLVPSTLISRVTEDSILVSKIIEQLMFLLQSIVYLVMSISMMADYSAKLTIMIIPVVVLYSLVLVFCRGWIFGISYNLQNNYSKLTGYLAERVSNIKMIKSSGTEAIELEKGKLLNLERFDISLNKVKYDTFLQSFQQYIGVFLTGLVIILGGKYVKDGSMKMASLISFYFFILQLPGNFQMIVQTLLEMQGTKGSTAYVSEIIDLPSEEIKRKEEMKEGCDIIFDKVSFSYDGETDVLKDFEAIIPSGKMTAIVGPSGCGKTTVLKLIERFYEASSGKILYGDLNLEDINLDEWRTSFGYVIQNSPLISGTVRDNIMYGSNKEVTDEEIFDILEIVNAKDFVLNLENGLDTDIGDLGSKLSGGQRQRIAIARAIINRPKFLLMDEATSNMDSLNEHQISFNLSDMMMDNTVVVVAHNLSTIINADQILVMDKGRVVSRGSHKELCVSCPLYRRMVELYSLT